MCEIKLNWIFLYLILLKDFEKEYQRQAFFMTKVVNGEIPATTFAEIMKNLRGHLLTPYVRAYLLTVRKYDLHLDCGAKIYNELGTHIYLILLFIIWLWRRFTLYGENRGQLWDSNAY